MNRTEYTTIKDTLRWSNLDRKDIDQAITTLALANVKMPIATQKSVYNGILQVITTGLLEGKDFDRDITIEDFNPKDPAIKQFYMEIDEVKEHVRQIDTKKLTQAFSNDGMRKGFKDSIVDGMTKSLDIDMFREHIRALFKNKVGSTPFSYDDEIQTGKFEKQDGTFDEDKVVKYLVDVNKLLDSFGTPGTYHTKFARDNKNSRYESSFDRADFRILYNAKFKNEMRGVRAKLFRPEELDFSVGTVMAPLDFDKIADDTFYGFTAAEKTKIKNTVAFIYHKDALNVIVPETGLTEQEIIQPGKFKTIYRVRAVYGHGRNELYPIVRIKIA